MPFKSLLWLTRKTSLVAVLLGLIAAAVATPALAASLVLNWSDTSTVETGFEIERMPSGGTYSQIATVGTNVQTYTDSNVVEGASYCYRVSAYNSVGTFALYTKGDWTDYRLSLTMRSTDDDTIGAMFRFKDDQNYYRFSWDKQAGFRRLEKRVNGTFTTMAADAAAYVIGQNYQLTIVAQGTKLQVSIDGQLVFSVTDSALSGGTVALYSHLNTGANFDNIMVEDMKTASILLWDNFNGGNFNGWTIIDETASNGPSVWSVNGGILLQSSNIGAGDAARSGTIALY